MTPGEPTRAGYPGILAAILTGTMLFQVAVQLVSGIRDGFDPVNIILIVISLVAVTLNAALFFFSGDASERTSTTAKTIGRRTRKAPPT